MKKIFTLFILSFTTYLSFSQTNPHWWQGSATSVLNGNVVFNQLNKNSTAGERTVLITGFTFANLPINPASFVVKGVVFTANRSAQGNAVIYDQRVAVHKADGQELEMLPLNTNQWPNSGFDIATYSNTSIDATVFNVGLADVTNPNFGISYTLSIASGASSASLKNFTLTIYYEYQTLLPIVLTKFDIEKTSQNFVNITWSTAAEDKVKMMYVERSSDGRNFTNLYEIAPKGAVNHSATYAVVDRAPMQGTNYYRLKEIDLDGNVAYFEVKQVSIAASSRRFQALYNGSSIKVNVINVPGEYHLSLIDANGAVLVSKMISLNSNSLQTELTIPAKRTGIYMVNLKGNGTNITERVFVQQ